jgi:hypothetical protein
MIDRGTIEISAQLLIRDPDSGETYVRLRDEPDKKKIREFIQRMTSADTKETITEMSFND